MSGQRRSPRCDYLLYHHQCNLQPDNQRHLRQDDLYRRRQRRHLRYYRLSGIRQYNQRSKPLYRFIPPAGYKLVDVKVDGVSIGARNMYCFPALSASHTIQDIFAPL